MNNKCNFSFEHYNEILNNLLSRNYTVYTCEEFIGTQNLKEPYIVLRHDIEYFPEKALVFACREFEAGIKSSYFFRVHAKEYNLYNYKIYDILKIILKYKHEIGLHTENLDFANVCADSAEDIIKKEKAFLELLLDQDIKGASPHCDLTEINNLDFWKKHTPDEFGFKYQTYEEDFFKNCVYVSDSLGKWKKYVDINKQSEPAICICDLINKGKNIYALIHPRTWYHKAYFLEY